MLVSEDKPTLLDRYFLQSGKRLALRSGDRLLEQHARNERLYLVLEGVLDGYLRMEDGAMVRAFESQPGQVVGLYSFFSEEKRSYATVIARTDCQLAYLDHAPETQPDVDFESLYRLFLPLLVSEISSRQRFAQVAARENETNLRQLLRAEKMATLGQMAAGLAHELNNAVGVLQRKTEWLSGVLADYLRQKDTQGLFPFFEMAREKGQFLATSEMRKLRFELQKAFGLSEEQAAHLAKTGLKPEALHPYADIVRHKLHRLMYYWEIGAALHDMTVSSTQAIHVVRSVKQLGVSGNTATEPTDINYTLQQALTILSSLLKPLQVELELGELPRIQANPGALMQIWVNLIKNAAESLIGSQSAQPVIRIRSSAATDWVSVEIIDNGPGIDPEIQDKIFQPDVTTKKEGLNFGLGLGLTIVQRLVFDHDGAIFTASRPGETTFTVTFPLPPSHG